MIFNALLSFGIVWIVSGLIGQPVVFALILHKERERRQGTPLLDNVKSQRIASICGCLLSSVMLGPFVIVLALNMASED